MPWGCAALLFFGLVLTYPFPPRPPHSHSSGLHFPGRVAEPSASYLQREPGEIS